MIRVGITGGAGYTAGELVRILLNHPEVELVFVHSESNAGNRLCDLHQGIYGDTDMVFSATMDLNAIDVLFLCSGHGRSEAFWKENEMPATLKVIDLAQDFRDEHDSYVYGLPEWQRSRIAAARKVANPGCFATCIQLALLPLASAGLLRGDVSVTAITGSTGAGVKPGATTHFSWRNDNVSAYKVFEHQHLIEICRNLRAAADARFHSVDLPAAAVARLHPGDVDCVDPTLTGPPSYVAAGGTVSRVDLATRCSGTVASIGDNASFNIEFVPMRGDFSRGIFATAVCNCPELGEDEAVALYNDYYRDAAFTFVCNHPVDLKEVVNTNKALVHLEKHGTKLVVTAVIDNLLKGASGQAVQNMNLIFGLPENTGLKLKASAF